MIERGCSANAWYMPSSNWGMMKSVLPLQTKCQFFEGEFAVKKGERQRTEHNGVSILSIKQTPQNYRDTVKQDIQ
jgi:hypothetical protein